MNFIIRAEKVITATVCETNETVLNDKVENNKVAGIYGKTVLCQWFFKIFREFAFLCSFTQLSILYSLGIAAINLHSFLHATKQFE